MVAANEAVGLNTNGRKSALGAVYLEAEVMSQQRRQGKPHGSFDVWQLLCSCSYALRQPWGVGQSLMKRVEHGYLTKLQGSRDRYC